MAAKPPGMAGRGVEPEPAGQTLRLKIGPATRRLYYLCSHVNLRGTPIEGWKLKLTSAEAQLN